MDSLLDTLRLGETPLVESTKAKALNFALALRRWRYAVHTAGPDSPIGQAAYAAYSKAIMNLMDAVHAEIGVFPVGEED